MRIDATKCMGCLECLDFCPMDCILDEGGVARVDEDECVECGVCLRAGVCPNDALFMPEEALRYPRVIRAQFRRRIPPLHESAGRTEMKTNDVTDVPPGNSAWPRVRSPIHAMTRSRSARLWWPWARSGGPGLPLVADRRQGSRRLSTKRPPPFSSSETSRENLQKLTPVLAVDTVSPGGWPPASPRHPSGPCPLGSRVSPPGPMREST
jgi:NAD-dependent dihydropyrimidine dehydrogenase PreA subunit